MARVPARRNGTYGIDAVYLLPVPALLNYCICCLSPRS